MTAIPCIAAAGVSTVRVKPSQVDGQRGRPGAIPGPLPGVHNKPFAGQISEGRAAAIVLETADDRLHVAASGLQRAPFRSVSR